MRKQSITNEMPAHVCMTIRGLWTSQQTQSHDISQCCKSIFRIIKDGYTVAKFRKIRPLVTDNLEFRMVPCRIIMRWSLDNSELTFIRGLLLATTIKSKVERMGDIRYHNRYPRGTQPLETFGSHATQPHTRTANNSMDP